MLLKVIQKQLIKHLSECVCVPCLWAVECWKRGGLWERTCWMKDSPPPFILKEYMGEKEEKVDLHMGGWPHTGSKKKRLPSTILRLSRNWLSNYYELLSRLSNWRAINQKHAFGFFTLKNSVLSLHLGLIVLHTERHEHNEHVPFYYCGLVQLKLNQLKQSAASCVAVGGDAGGRAANICETSRQSFSWHKAVGSSILEPNRVYQALLLSVD